MSYRKKILDFIEKKIDELGESGMRELYGLAQREYGLTLSTFTTMLREMHYCERIRFNEDLETIESLKDTK